MYITKVNLEITICQTSDCLIINVLNKTTYKYIILYFLKAALLKMNK